MKQQFIQLTSKLLNSDSRDELNNNRIVLNNFIENLKLTFDNPEVKVKAKNHLIKDINDYVEDPSNEVYRYNLSTKLRIISKLVVE